ncbi:MAG TPA: TetR/AcrR family transcriptional regulator [Coleofasciculaceae cyanobacterium]|jgi:AcrR family transcriptional regulator
MARKRTIAERKELIVQTAEQLFNHYGYDKTTMEDISREAGIPRATIYLDFPGGKVDILMANIAKHLEDSLASMRKIARQSKDSRLETLKQVILFYVLSTYDKASRHRYDPNNMERHCSRVREEMAGYFRLRTVFFAELLKHAAMKGEIPISHDFFRLAELVTQGISCFLPPHSTQYEREALERDADAFFSLLLSGLLKTHHRATALIS